MKLGKIEPHTVAIIIFIVVLLAAAANRLGVFDKLTSQRSESPGYPTGSPEEASPEVSPTPDCLPGARPCGITCIPKQMPCNK